MQLGDVHRRTRSKGTNASHVDDMSGPQKLAFISLPAEVRVIIYEMLFEDSQIRIHEDSFYRRSVSAASIQERLGLICTCRTIYWEALHLLAKSTTLRLEMDCPETDLPVTVQRLFLPHIQHLVLGTMLVHFPWEHLPDLKTLTILDRHLVQHSRNYVTVNVQSDEISAMAPFVTGAQDDLFISMWVQNLDHLEDTDSERLSMNSQSTLKTWQQIQRLPASVAVFFTFRVALKFIQGVGDPFYTMTLSITFNLRNKKVISREIVDRKSRSCVDAESVRRLLSSQSQRLRG